MKKVLIFGLLGISNYGDNLIPECVQYMVNLLGDRIVCDLKNMNSYFYENYLEIQTMTTRTQYS